MSRSRLPARPGTHHRLLCCLFALTLKLLGAQPVWATPIIVPSPSGGMLGRVMVNVAGLSAAAGVFDQHASTWTPSSFTLTFYHLDLLYGAPVPGAMIAGQANRDCLSWFGAMCGMDTVVFDFTGVHVPDVFVFGLTPGTNVSASQEPLFGFGIVWGQQLAAGQFAASGYQWPAAPGSGLTDPFGFGRGAYVPAISFEAVPEPASALLYSAIATALFVRHRLRRCPG